MPTLRRVYQILVVEDNPTDVSLIEEALSENGIPYELVVLRDGEKALRHLETLDGNDRPDLIIVDLNIPKHDGFKVLCEYRVKQALRSVPMLILTSSDSPRDRQRARDIGVSAFIQKPMTLEGFIALGPKFKAIIDTPYSYFPQPPNPVAKS
jgi:two-component system, chemotaxis family, response regulator Rcp1